MIKRVFVALAAMVSVGVTTVDAATNCCCCCVVVDQGQSTVAVTGVPPTSPDASADLEKTAGTTERIQRFSFSPSQSVTSAPSVSVTPVQQVQRSVNRSSGLAKRPWQYSKTDPRRYRIH